MRHQRLTPRGRRIRATALQLQQLEKPPVRNEHLENMHRALQSRPMYAVPPATIAITPPPTEAYILHVRLEKVRPGDPRYANLRLQMPPVQPYP